MTRAIAAIGMQSQQFFANQQATGAALEALTAQIKAISQRPNTTAPTYERSGDHDGPRGVARFNQPHIFNGSASDVDSFVDDIAGAIRLSRASLPNDEDKALYLNSYLGNGSPKSWFNAIRATIPHLLDDYEELIINFREHFGDSDVEATALRKIDALRQTSSCSTYASRFREQLIHVDFSESTKILKFYEGLKEEVKDLLLTVADLPIEFNKYVAKAIEIDNRVHRRYLERLKAKRSGNSSSSSNSHQPRSSNSGNTRSNNVAPPPPSAPELPPGIPMEIDATKTKRLPLTQEERERRRREGLCSYCGLGKHLIANCPNMSDRARKNFAAKSQTAPASSGKV